MNISICIPTYNRAIHLANCLRSIIASKLKSSIDFQVCVSDNCSTDETERVVRSAQKEITIKYQKNQSNLGVARNVLNVVQMSDGEFVWLIGDDDLLLPYALEELNDLIVKHSNVDYFYINSFHLKTQFVLSFPQPFNTFNLPEKMEPFSSWIHSGEMKFMDLVDPKISFDFLGGMFLSVFRRENWILNVNIVDNEALLDSRVFSHFDNTFVHVKIFSKAFAKSKAFFNAKPLSVCLTGAREWAPMYPFIRSVRLVEALDEYRENGLSYVKYFQCKNFALKTFLPDLVFMFVNRDNSGFDNIELFKMISKNLLYPNFYLSIIYYIIRKFKVCLSSFRNTFIIGGF